MSARSAESRPSREYFAQHLIGPAFVVELEVSESAEGLPLRATGEWSVRSR